MWSHRLCVGRCVGQLSYGAGEFAVEYFGGGNVCAVSALWSPERPEMPPAPILRNVRNPLSGLFIEARALKARCVAFGLLSIPNVLFLCAYTKIATAVI